MAPPALFCRTPMSRKRCCTKWLRFDLCRKVGWSSYKKTKNDRCYEERRLKKQLSLTTLALLLVAGVVAHAADTRKETRLDLASGGTLTIVDNYGSVTLRSGFGKQVTITSVTHSAKVESDQNVTADRHRAE